MLPTPATAPRRAATLLAPLVVALLLVACSRGGAESASPNPPAGVGAAAEVSTTTGPPPPVPDLLPDPGVAPGECKVVTYTPPTAKSPMPGELCRPAAAQRDVAVIVVHGGSGIGGSYQGMRRWANRYLAEGYVTFLPGYHLFAPGGESPVFPHPEQNIKAAVQYLRGAGNALGIRKDRIVVQGQSAGARVGAVAYTSPDDPWFAGPELHPRISDAVNGFIGFYHPYDGTMQFADQYFGGNDYSTSPKVLERLAQADALANADRAVGPALFITGDKDWNIIQLQQDAFAAALVGRGMPAQAFVVPGGAHGFDEGGQRLSKLGEQSAALTLRWLNDQFPQNPAREPQTAPIDLDVLPDVTGVPPTTYVARPRPAGGYGNKPSSGYRPTTSAAGGGSGDGGVSTTAGPTSTGVSPTTLGPTTTSGASTTVAPSTTNPPPTTIVTVPPTTVVTQPPPTTAPATP